MNIYFHIYVGWRCSYFQLPCLKILGILIIVFLISGCSNTKFLGENETLYTGIKKLDLVPMEDSINVRKLRSDIYWTVYYKPNNSFYLPRRILPPLRLWSYNYLKPKKDKGLKYWLNKQFSEPPVLVEDLNLDLRSQKIENNLYNMGYFNVHSGYEVIPKRSNPKKASVYYRTKLWKPYSLVSLTYDDDSLAVDSLIRNSFSTSKITPGELYNLDKLISERDRIVDELHSLGYYYFKSNYLVYEADTSHGNNSVDITLQRFRDIPPKANYRFTIHSITVHLQSVKKDSALLNIPGDTLIQDNVIFIFNKLFIKPEVLANAIHLRPGDIYSSTEFRNTRNHLNNLGVFRQVEVKYSETDTSGSFLDMHIYLEELEKVDISLEMNLVTKSSGFAGPAGTVSLTDQNIRNGAEKFSVKLNGGFEWQLRDQVNTGLGFNSYELGINTNLTLPRIYPNIKGLGNMNFYVPKTRLNMGFEILNRVRYYRMNSWNASLTYNWKGSDQNSHLLTLQEVNYVNLVDTTAEFSEIFKNNSYIRKSFEEQFIHSIRYNYAIDNTNQDQLRNTFFLSTGISTAGNFLFLIDRLSNGKGNEKGTFLGNPYSQFVKSTFDIRQYHKTYRGSQLVSRLFIGAGIPYGKSVVMPYVEQFFVGGANSVRGFPARSLGPGSYKLEMDEESSNTYIDQTGDIKIELNWEYRFKIGAKLYGAAFIDVGNIWLVKTDSTRPGSEFHWNEFYNQFGVGTGIGFRFDINFFVLRFDIGTPLRRPSEPNNKWVFETGDFLRRKYFYIAIGYPF